MSNPKFSICIPTYQNHTRLHNLLKSIDENTVMEYEIVLNDNSFDPIGYPKATNDCMKRARGEYIVLLNDDVIVESLWLEKMYSKLIEDPKYGLVGPDSVRNDNWGNPHTSFYCVMFHRKMLEEIGYLDERFGIGCVEDVDYCKRICDKGYKIVAISIPVIHEGSKTFPKIKPVQDLINEGTKLYKEKWGYK